MKIEQSNYWWATVVCALWATASLFGQSKLGPLVQLPNGWKIQAAGKSIPLGDLPLNMTVSPDQKYLVVTNNGQSKHTLDLIDVRKQKVVHTLTLSHAWYGLQFVSDKKLFASGGHKNLLWEIDIVDKALVLKDSILLGKPWPDKMGPSGIAFHSGRRELYVTTREGKALYTVSLNDRQVKKITPLSSEAYTCVLSKDSKFLFISEWDNETIAVYDTEREQLLEQRIHVGDHPNELLLNKKGDRLFVACAGDNTVWIIDTRTNEVKEVLHSSLQPESLTGSVTNGIALSEDETRLYIANADNNAVALFDVRQLGQSKSLGFIPVGWYPTNVKCIGKKVWVTNGKGLSSFPNPDGPNPVEKKQSVNYQKADPKKAPKVQYIAGLMVGSMSIFKDPTPNDLSRYTTVVYQNVPYRKDKELVAEHEAGNPIPGKVGDPSPIKHVFYILKENRTYDQVLSDLAGGNGDTSLLLFGRRITPNQHKLAETFVLLDNFYVDGEVSADGHNWSTAAHSNDYLEKTWPSSYGGKGGDYDAEGNKRIANPKKGFIWDYCARAGVSYRTYGEFADDYKPNIPVLKDHFCTYYTSWDESVRDTTRFYQWKRDFDSLLAVNKVPQLNTLRFINDHTEGLRTGRPTPFAHVADNDLAVGMFVEYLSKSPIWEQSVVFIVEDDAQNGPDHVDAHRTTAYVAGGYVKRGYIDHTLYSTSSMLRTIELILGLPPMSQYDAAATPMFRCFSKQADLTPFQSLPAQVNLNDKNTSLTESAIKSNGFDFSSEDKVPDLEFSKVIWKAVKGEDSEMPAPRRAAFLSIHEED
jgi:DNA-binding beta-propeller fold protein YncE